MSSIDLHTHSTASDGLLSPSELVTLAIDSQLRAMSLTDHDSTEGLDEAIAAGRAVGLEVVPGVELGTDVAAGELHMLGYFLDYKADVFQRTLAHLRDGRLRRAERMVERLQAAGMVLSFAELQELAGQGAITRAHLARLLVARGFATSMDDAFARYLARGRPGYVPRPRLSPSESIRLIRSAGGVPVLAHPLTVAELEPSLERLVGTGLLGLEVYYAQYDAEQQRRLLELARRYQLVPTGGSDFHGAGEREGRELGSAPVPPETVDLLRDRATRSSR